MAKANAKMTLRELEFSDVALADAKPRATKHARALMAKVILDTPIGDFAFFKGAGCDACQGTGFKGRQGLYETMNMTPHLRRMIMQNAGAADIGKAAIAEGMLTLRMGGWLKILKGITTLDQVVRVTSV